MTDMPPSILTVDDNSRNIQVLAAVLDTAGYRIAAASSGRQALDMIEAVAPDLVLLDVMMPGMGGFDVCRRIVGSPATADIPVIMLTARTAPEDVATGFEAGAVDYITKPFNTKELLARVRSHVRLRRARKTRSRQIKELKIGLSQIDTLSGLLPICSQCKKIRSDEGYWQQLEAYITEHSGVIFSHGICPECMAKHYPEFAPKDDGNLKLEGREKSAAHPPDRDPGGHAGREPTILMVDDAPENLQVLGSVLKKRGYRVAAAIDGTQAMAMIGQIPPDLILLDVVMPGTDGYSLCRALKASPDTARIPVIMLTAKSDREDIVKGFESGAEDYVAKPFKTTELLSRVKTHLEIKRLGDEQTLLIYKLEESLAKIKQLSILIPICAHCHKVRDDQGYWQQVEAYLSSRSHAQFRYSLCTDCRKNT